MTRTALYNYFPDKAALLLAFTERVTTYFIESFERGLPKNADATARLRAFIRLQLRGLLAHPHPSAAEVTAALGPDAYESLAAHVAPMQRILTGILTEEWSPASSGGRTSRPPRAASSPSSGRNASRSSAVPPPSASRNGTSPPSS